MTLEKEYFLFLFGSGWLSGFFVGLFLNEILIAKNAKLTIHREVYLFSSTFFTGNYSFQPDLLLYTADNLFTLVPMKKHKQKKKKLSDCGT